MDTMGPAARVTKKAERDAQRAAANRSRKRIGRWASLVKRLRYERIWMPVWTEWQRSRMRPECDARRKIRAAFWQEWTRPQFAGGSAKRLGLLSGRDRFILAKADALMAKAFPFPGDAPFGPGDFQSEDAMLQAAIAASLLNTSLETQDGDRTDGTRSLDVAGIITPDTSRKAGKKKRGGRSSGSLGEPSAAQNGH